MMRELFAACAVVAVASLVGCNKKDEAPVDPYVEASLREAVYGEVVSPDFKYKLIAPEIVDGLGEFLVVRQTNMTEFIAGNGIASKVDSLGAEELTFNVVKQFSPVVHFLCMSIVTPTDSILIPSDKPIAFPRTADAASFVPPPDYVNGEMINFRWNDTEQLRGIIDSKHSLRAHLVRVPEDSVTSWMLVGDSSQTVWGEVPKLRINTPRPSLEIILRVLERTKQEFVGGVTYTTIEPWDFRRKNHVCGTVEIGYVRFQDKVFSR
jgi:hypothetical protein